MKALMHQNLGVLEYNIAVNSGEGGNSRKSTVQAVEHLSKSVNIFKTYFDNSEDSSLAREYVYSLQMLAAVKV